LNNIQSPIVRGWDSKGQEEKKSAVVLALDNELSRGSSQRGKGGRQGLAAVRECGKNNGGREE